ncbi:MAG: bifunctional acetaldehyde-CoA/alcohol dehydrogenase, partial [Okeania sp. SIO3C4]|nr:bifunctional acetaldehyde-CoA/alcohol dehydrogenase [Okeania sp. SIO3C4]
IVACIEQPTIEGTNALMRHAKINLILATGGPGMVKAAYSSGKPAIGVGAGNTPVIIDATADLQTTVSSILMSKTFDNGVICASEQSIVVEEAVYKDVRAEMERRGAYYLSKSEKGKLAKVLVGDDGHISAKIVGQSANKVADMAGISVPENTKVLIAEVSEVGMQEPFSLEKLSPVLACYKEADYEAALARANELIMFGGAGHTAVLYTDETADHNHIERFQFSVRVARALVNMPASQGAIGDVYNFRLAPSLTLGCGSWGGNSVSENIGVFHLMNVKSVARRSENMQWYRVPPKIYFKQGALQLALKELKGRTRAFVMADPVMEELGYVQKVGDILEAYGMHVRTFSDVQPDPDLNTVHAALEQINPFEPDVIVALGGGSPMDAAKIVWLLYENPTLKFEDVALRFMDIRKKIATFPEMGRKAIMVAVPTTSGTGSEVTPFAVITDNATGIKYPIADYELTPDMAIIDPELVATMPKSLVANGGVDAITHAIESFTSVFANNFSDGQALEALRLLFKYLPDSYNDGAHKPIAREKVHYAATMAGMSFANAFLGVCHSMAHKLGAAFHLPHGLANALLIGHVIRYNATDNPTKQGLLPVYKYPFVKGRYARIADHLGLTKGIEGDDHDPDVRTAKIEALIKGLDKLQEELGMPKTIKECGVSEADFMAQLDEMCEQAFDDQCTGGNPRYPLISELRQIYLDAYHGTGPALKVVEKDGKARPAAAE